MPSGGNHRRWVGAIVALVVGVAVSMLGVLAGQFWLSSDPTPGEMRARAASSRLDDPTRCSTLRLISPLTKQFDHDGSLTDPSMMNDILWLVSDPTPPRVAEAFDTFAHGVRERLVRGVALSAHERQEIGVLQRWIDTCTPLASGPTR